MNAIIGLLVVGFASGLFTAVYSGAAIWNATIYKDRELLYFGAWSFVVSMVIWFLFGFSTAKYVSSL